MLLLGQVGSGKSSLLGALAGLVGSTGSMRWNGRRVGDPQIELRPGRVAHVAQVPKVLSGTFRDNVLLDHPGRVVEPGLAAARLERDVAEAGGPDARRRAPRRTAVRRSGAAARAGPRLGLRCRAAPGRRRLLGARCRHRDRALGSLRERRATVIGATSKSAALARADRVVVLVDGLVADQGPWAALQPRWGHLAG